MGLNTENGTPLEPEDYPSEGWMLVHDMTTFDGAVIIEDFPADLKSMQECVDGLIEYVPLGADRSFVMPLGVMGELVDIIVNEEGLYRNDFTFNPVATIFANGSHGFNGFDGGPFNLVGPALIHFKCEGKTATLADIQATISENAQVEIDSMGEVSITSNDGVRVDGSPNLHFARIHEESLEDFTEEE